MRPQEMDEGSGWDIISPGDKKSNTYRRTFVRRMIGNEHSNFAANDCDSCVVILSFDVSRRDLDTLAQLEQSPD